MELILSRMSRKEKKYAIVRKEDFQFKWITLMTGEFHDPRESNDGRSWLLKFDELPEGLTGITRKRVKREMQKPEWSKDEPMMTREN